MASSLSFVLILGMGQVLILRFGITASRQAIAHPPQKLKESKLRKNHFDAPFLLTV
jgi:hypothetical protein